MKKSLIALAVVAASGASFAQSSVTVFGTFDPSFANQKTTYGGGAAVTQNTILNNAQGTSQITFKGVEDLGGGLKASFLLENDFDTKFDAKGTDGTSTSKGVSNFGSSGGEQYLALSGGFGSIAAGAANTPSLSAQASANPFGTKIGSGFGAMNTGRVRSNNSLVFTTPTFSGFSAKLAYANQTKATATSVASATANAVTQDKVSTGANTDIGLFYANGPVAAGVSFWKTNAADASAAATATLAGASTDNKQTNAYVTYDLGVAKIGAGYYTEKQDNTGSATGASGIVAATLTQAVTSIDSKAYNISAAVPLNANLSLLANYAKKDDKTSLNLDRTVSAIGVKYTFSKNTSVYARVVSDTTDNVAAGATKAAAKVQTTLIGMQTNF